MHWLFYDWFHDLLNMLYRALLHLSTLSIIMNTIANILFLEKRNIRSSHIVSQPKFMPIFCPMHHIHWLIASEASSIQHNSKNFISKLTNYHYLGWDILNFTGRGWSKEVNFYPCSDSSSGYLCWVNLLFTIGDFDL